MVQAKKTVLLDMDGTICNLADAVIEVYGEPEGWPVGEYDLETLYGMETQDFWEGLKPLEKFFEELPWMDDGPWILMEAMEAAGKENIWLLTSPAAGPGSFAGKLAWVERQLGFSHGVDWPSRLVFAQDKRCCAWPGAYLIDDCDENVRLFREAGGEAVLVPRHWNSGVGDAMEAVRKGLNGAGGMS